jgi:hypothetical protein
VARQIDEIAMSDLHDRVAHALGWTPAETRSVSMQSLRDLVRPVDPDLAQEISHVIQSGAYVSGTPAAKTSSAARKPDALTAVMLRDASVGPGDLPRLVATAKPARDVAKTPTLATTLANLRAKSDRSVGFVSKALAYSRAMPHSKREHANLIRLIKGGYVRVGEVAGPPPEGSSARRDAPYGDRYYELIVTDE